MSIHYHLHCQCSHPPWPLAWTTIIDSKLAHCRKKCFCLFVCFKWHIWLLIWLKRTCVVWPLVTTSAASFSTRFSAISALCMPVFIHYKNMLWSPREGYLSPHPPITYSSRDLSPRLSKWVTSKTDLWVPVSWHSDSCVFSTHSVQGWWCDQKNAGEVMVYVTPRLGFKTPPLPPWSCAHALSLLDYLLWGKPALM